ncbi:MAG: hypothetical protein ACOC1F_07090 [Myxococcota bacterium]
MKATRRELVGWLGATALVAPSLVTASPAVAGPAHEPARDPARLSAGDLLAPLAIGSQIGAWTVVRFGALHAGAVGVELRGPAGDAFHIDICARDTTLGSPSAPASTDRCELFVANEGSGHDPTQEQQGLAAMALAEIVRTHEHQLDLSGLLTLRERLTRYGDDVVRTCVEG